MMEFQSRRQFRFGVVLADAAVLQFRLPDGRYRTFKTLVLGAANFSRMGKHEQLEWPPITIFTRFTADFLKAEGALGYAKRMSLSGKLVKTHLIHNDHERDQIKILQTRLIGKEVQLFRMWLRAVDHAQTVEWQQQIRKLRRSIEAYAGHHLTLEKLIAQFEVAYTTDRWHEQRRVNYFEKRAWNLSAQFERQLDQLCPVAFLVVNVKNIELYLCTDQRDSVLPLEENDRSKAYNSDYLLHMYDQLKTQKRQSQELGLPFYDPSWLDARENFHQPVWAPHQSDAYHIEAK